MTFVTLEHCVYSDNQLTKLYHIVQNFQGTKLLWLGHHVSICRKTFTFASKQHPQVPKHFKIHGKIFVIQARTIKGLALERFVLYGI